MLLAFYSGCHQDTQHCTNYCIMSVVDLMPHLIADMVHISSPNGQDWVAANELAGRAGKGVPKAQPPEA